MPETEPIWAVRTRRLTKRFPEKERLAGLLPATRLGPPVVDAVDLSIAPGELFGLLGPNGAGKTTLVKMLATLVEPTGGAAEVCGYNLLRATAIKAAIGLVTTDERSFYWRLTGRQNLDFFAALHGLSDVRGRVAEMLTLVGLEDAADRSFKEYSTGMRQRLAIARALLHRPQVLFLDEPTRGLDPAAIQALHSFIREDLTGRQGLTVLLTTHWLQEAEKLCDRVAILHKGRLRGCGTLAELRGLIGETAHYRLQVGDGSQGLEAALSPLAQASGAQEWTLPDVPAALNRAVDAVRREGGTIELLQREETPLETIFERLTGDGQGEGITEHGGGAQADSPATAAKTRRAPLPLPATIPFWRVALAFLRRDWQSERSYRLAFLLSFGGIFFSVAVFYFVARLLGDAAAPFLSEYGGDYFAFVLIGIAFQRYFGLGLTSFAATLRQAQTTGTLEAMLTAPVRLSYIILASSLWSYGLTTLQVGAYLFVGAAFLGVALVGNYGVAVLVLALTVIAFSSLGILSASFVMVLKRGDPITWAIGAASTFFGGVYFPVGVLPDWLQWISALLPVTYSLRAMRLALLQGAGFGRVWPDLLALAVFCAVLLPASLLAFRYAVRRARLEGSLTHY
jgi:ABC-2 type transport system permease protein